MTFTIDLDTLTLVRAPQDSRAAATPEAKRGDGTPFEVQVVRNGIVTELPTGAVLTFGCKPKGKYDGPAVVLQVGFTKDGSGATTKYTASPSFNTVGLDALFLVDGNDGNDVADVTLMAEFSWKADDEPPTSTRTFDFKVNNDVLRGDEETPAALPDPSQWMPASLILSDAPVDGSLGEKQKIYYQFSGTVGTGGNISVTFRYPGQPNAGPYLIAVSNGDAFGAVRTAILNELLSHSAVTDLATLTSVSTNNLSVERDIEADFSADFGLTISMGSVTGISVLPALITSGSDPVTGTVATREGQGAIVNENDIYQCVRVTPVKWIGPLNP